jgi:predicted deacetylase
MKTKLFVVCVHDVAPRAEREMAGLWPRLDWLVGPAVSAAIIPAGSGPSWQKAGRSLLATLRSAERLLHGFSHHRKPGLSCVSMACGRSDELAGLPAGEIGERLRKGQQIMTETFGHPAEGFLPPAWRTGVLTMPELAREGMTFLVDYTALTTPDGRKIRLATYSWDWGPWAALGKAGSALGRLSGLRTGCVPVVAIHPCDERRGYLPSALDMVKGLLAAGHEPVTFRELVRMHR